MSSGYPWTAWLFWIGGAVLALSGVALFWWAMFKDRSRGRKRCPKCWYDLSGIVAAPGTSFPITCSECGKVIPREKLLSKTRRRKRFASVGMVLMIVSICSIGWVETRNLDWNTVKPVWWLKRQGRTDSPDGKAARGELFRRLKNGLLSDGQVHEVVQHALSIQADPSAFWRGRTFSIGSSWGDFIEEAWDAELLTHDEIQKYLETAFGASFTVKVRPCIRTGELLPVEFRTGMPRLSERGFRYDPNGNVLSALGELISITGADFEKGHEASMWNIGSSATAGFATWRHFDCHLEPGHHQVEFEVEFAVFKVNRKQGLSLYQDSHVATMPGAMSRWKAKYTVDVEVVPHDQEIIHRVADELLKDTIRNATRIELTTNSIETPKSTYGGRYGIILIDALPVALSCDVFCRAGGIEKYVGSFATAGGRKGIDNAEEGFANDPKELFPNADVVDVIFRTNTEAAEGTIDIDEVWDGEVVFENVPLPKESPKSQ